MKFTAVLTVLLLSLCACKGGGDSEGGVSGDEYLTLGYARGFNVRQCDGYKLLTVQDPQGESTAVFRFALKKKGCDADIPAGLDVVEIPMHRIVCMTELQLSAFIKLGNTDDVC